MTPEAEARIAPVEPPYDDATGASLIAMMGGRLAVEPLALFRTMIKNKPLVAAFGPLGRYMLASQEKGGASYDLRSREIVIDRATARCGCEYEWGVHIAGYAEKAGMDAEQISAIVHEGPEAPCWSPKDHALIAMVDELHDDGAMSDETWVALAGHFDEPQILDLLVLAGWYHAISYIANGARVPLETWAARFPSANPAAA